MSPNVGQPEDLAFHKGLPSNVEIEIATLGSILLNDQVFPEVASALKPDDFFLEKHKRIFRAMTALQQEGKRIDDLTLGSHLEQRNELESCDGYAYIASLTEGLPLLNNINEYVAIVKAKAVRRRLISECENITARAIEDSEPNDDLLGAAEQAIFQIGNGLVTTGPSNPREIFERYPGGVGALLDPTKGPKGLATPFTRLNQMTGGFRPGQLVVVASRPSMGKTALGLDIALGVTTRKGADEQGKTALVFSMEMSEQEIMQRLLCSVARVDSSRYRAGRLDAEERRRLNAALGELDRSRLLIDDRADTTLMQIGAKCRRAKAQQGLGLVIVDYLQLLGSSNRPENRTQEVAAFSRGLKRLAMDLRVPVIALSQLNRAVEGRADKRPNLGDLRDSGSIEQDADIVALLYREEYYKPDKEAVKGLAELNVAKQRNGPTGTIALTFIGKYATFENPMPAERVA